MKSPRRFTLLRVLMIVLALATPAMAADNVARDPASTASGTHQTNVPTTQAPSAGKLTYKRFHRVLGRNLTSNLFTQHNLLPFLIGSAGALAIAPADQEISDALRDHAHEYGSAGQIVGGVVTASFVGGSVLLSQFSQSDHFKSFGYTLAEAYATNFILTQGLKYATHRMRPDGSSSTSFPSGHTSDTFTVATVVSSYYGKKWGIPLYVLAGLVGVSRIEQGRHWASDAVAGAALGYISGSTAVRGTKRELAGKKTLSGMIIAPVYGHDYRGISVRFSY